MIYESRYRNWQSREREKSFRKYKLSDKTSPYFTKYIPCGKTDGEYSLCWSIWQKHGATRNFRLLSNCVNFALLAHAWWFSANSLEFRKKTPQAFPNLTARHPFSYPRKTKLTVRNRSWSSIFKKAKSLDVLEEIKGFSTSKQKFNCL